jgi:hypothetical protein
MKIKDTEAIAMSEKEAILKLDVLIEFFKNYNKILSVMEENIESAEIRLAA